MQTSSLVQGAMLLSRFILESLGLLCLSGATSARPQTDITVAIAESTSPLVSEIPSVGLRRISPAAVEAQISKRTGTPLDARQIEVDVRKLASLGWFESIQVETPTSTLAAHPSDQEPASVAITFHLEELPEKSMLLACNRFSVFAWGLGALF